MFISNESNFSSFFRARVLLFICQFREGMFCALAENPLWDEGEAEDANERKQRGTLVLRHLPARILYQRLTSDIRSEFGLFGA